MRYEIIYKSKVKDLEKQRFCIKLPETVTGAIKYCEKFIEKTVLTFLNDINGTDV